MKHMINNYRFEEKVQNLQNISKNTWKTVKNDSFSPKLSVQIFWMTKLYNITMWLLAYVVWHEYFLFWIETAKVIKIFRK